MPTVPELRKWASEAAADLAKLEDALRQAREQIPQLEELIAAQRDQFARLKRMLAASGDTKGLTMVDTDSTVVGMDVNTDSESVRRAAGRATRNHAAQKKLYKAGITITGLAALLKEGRPRVSSWFAEGDANRPIPRRHAKLLLEKYGIPLSAWARVTD